MNIERWPSLRKKIVTYSIIADFAMNYGVPIEDVVRTIRDKHGQVFTSLVLGQMNSMRNYH